MDYSDVSFLGYLQELIDCRRIEGKEAGITKQVLSKGYDSLSYKQRIIFNQVSERFVLESCKRCGADIPWSEMLDALDNGGLCGYCQHVRNRITDE